MTEEKHFRYRGFNYYCTIAHSNNNLCNPIVLLSGAFQSMKSWDRYLKFYNKLAPVILVDLPGTGKSDLLSSDYSLEFLADSLEHLFREINLNKAEIVAVSYGSPIGILFNKRYPYLVSHLALIGTMKKFPDKLIKRAEHTFLRIENNEMTEFALEVVDIIMNEKKRGDINKFEVIKRILISVLEKIDDEGKRKYIENTKRLIICKEDDFDFHFNNPVLVITGEHDSFTKPEYCREISSFFKNAIFTTIKQSDHLCNLQQFDITNELIIRFLSDKNLNLSQGCNQIEYFKKPDLVSP